MTTNSRGDEWSAYWVGAEGGQAAVAGDNKAASLSGFWSKIFERSFAGRKTLSHIDMACGAGTVTQSAISVADKLKTPQASFVCSDYSESAVHRAISTINDERVCGVVSDGSSPALKSDQFDVVTSQYGLEYAGKTAFEKACSLVAQDGYFAALVHIKDGPIARECKTNLSLLDDIIDQSFLPRMVKLMATARKMDQGHTSEKQVKKLERSLFTDQAKMLQAIQAIPPNPASILAFRLLSDMGTLYQRRRNFADTDADGWLAHQKQELASYQLRMRSMVEAAMSEVDMNDIVAALDSKNASEPEVSKFNMDGEEEACAWSLVLRR